MCGANRRGTVFGEPLGPVHTPTPEQVMGDEGCRCLCLKMHHQTSYFKQEQSVSSGL